MVVNRVVIHLTTEVGVPCPSPIRRNIRFGSPLSRGAALGLPKSEYDTLEYQTSEYDSAKYYYRRGSAVSMVEFVNRTEELSRLHALYESSDAELAVIFGRR